jgi:hypothetical protein
MIEQIRTKIKAGQFEFSRHAVDQSILREISVQELREAIINGEIIEDYPRDKYSPSCLLLGFTAAGRPLHVQCSYPSRPLVKIITLYEPGPDKWIDFRVRIRLLQRPARARTLTTADNQGLVLGARRTAPIPATLRRAQDTALSGQARRNRLGFGKSRISSRPLPRAGPSVHAGIVLESILRR